MLCFAVDEKRTCFVFICSLSLSFTQSIIIMNNSYESICQELDSLAVLYLTKLNEYTHEWKYTANDFKQVQFEMEDCDELTKVC